MSDAKSTTKGNEAAEMQSIESLGAEEAVGALIDLASRMGASDLFIFTEEGGTSVAVRHLGILRRVAKYDKETGRRFINTIKAKQPQPRKGATHSAGAAPLGLEHFHSRAPRADARGYLDAAASRLNPILEIREEKRPRKSRAFWRVFSVVASA